MAANRFVQSIVCVWHVAVVAIAAGRIDRVMSMSGKLLGGAELIVALKTRFASQTNLRQLVVGITFVHAVTTDAGNLAFGITLRCRHSAEFTATTAISTITPKT